MPELTDSPSKLQLRSVGIVAANKPLDSKEIEVVLIENSLMLDGEMTDALQDYSGEGQDSQGSKFQNKLKTTASVRATWRPDSGSNRSTAPDVRRGEKVKVYQFADSDNIYYWTTWDYEPDYRKLETVVYTWSATQDEKEKAGYDNQYSLEISTHRKVIALHTTDKNGEACKYDIQINTDEGTLTIMDDIGNYIFLDSVNVRLQLKNADAAWIDMNRKDITIDAPDNIFMKAGKNIEMTAGKQIKSKAGTEINDDAPTITTKANKTNNTVPLTTFTGNVTITSMLATKSFGSGAGGGSFEVTSPGTFTRPVTVQKLTSQEPIDAPNVD